MALSDLIPASFRGVPFAIVRAGGQFGRRLSVHQYPGRDTPWTEDLGRGARRYRFTGFLLEGDLIYGGAEIDLQRAALIAAAELAGSGILTHPTLGILTVSCESLSISDDVSADNFCEIEFSFIEFGQQIFPSLLLDTGNAVISAVTSAAATIADDFASVIALSASSGASNQSQASTAATAWSAQVEAGGADATAILGLASQLSGSYGRYSAGANAGFSSGTVYVNSTTVAQLSTAAATARATIASAASTFTNAATSLNASATAADIAAAGQALVAALSAACADPADAVRLLLALEAYDPGITTTVGSAISDLMRRAAVCSLAQASSTYQPSSYDDAANILSQVTTAIDNEIEVAGNEALDDTFNSLCAIRQAVQTDLTTRGATLAPIKTFQVPANVPDIVLAQRIYRDPTRADQLTTQVDEINPLFMPTSFQALAS